MWICHFNYSIIYGHSFCGYHSNIFTMLFITHFTLHVYASRNNFFFLWNFSMCALRECLLFSAFFDIILNTSCRYETYFSRFLLSIDNVCFFFSNFIHTLEYVSCMNMVKIWMVDFKMSQKPHKNQMNLNRQQDCWMNISVQFNFITFFSLILGHRIDSIDFVCGRYFGCRWEAYANSFLSTVPFYSLMEWSQFRVTIYFNSMD